MKLNILHHHNRSAGAVEVLLESYLSSLARRRHIEAVFARFEESHHRSPRFVAHIHLVTPGPDINASASDHSLAAAVAKAAKKLESSVEHRERKRAARGRNHQLRSPLMRTARAVG